MKGPGAAVKATFNYEELMGHIFQLDTAPHAVVQVVLDGMLRAKYLCQDGSLLIQKEQWYLSGEANISKHLIT